MHHSLRLHSGSATFTGDCGAERHAITVCSHSSDAPSQATPVERNMLLKESSGLFSEQRSQSESGCQNAKFNSRSGILKPNLCKNYFSEQLSEHLQEQFLTEDQQSGLPFCSPGTDKPSGLWSHMREEMAENCDGGEGKWPKHDPKRDPSLDNVLEQRQVVIFIIDLLRPRAPDSLTELC